ncbi:MAG: hypothetical protein K6A36_05850 [Paludibacteraceae bacterium]|nr:hypothetical protein [Paludibacteraceae bacterium]
MKKNIIICIYSLLCIVMITSCSNGLKHEDYWISEQASKKLIAKGIVMDQDSVPLANITVTIHGVRDENEPDAYRYNYVMTDSIGRYMIIRHAGRELPTEATLVATDSAGIYAEQIISVPITYQMDTIYGYGSHVNLENAYVIADFILQKQ